MKINSIHLSIDTCKEIGLGFVDGIEMKNPGQVVGLFGKNGAGKTRFLNIIHRLLTGDGNSGYKYLLAKCLLTGEIDIDFSNDEIKNKIDDLKEYPDAAKYAEYKYYQAHYSDRYYKTQELYKNNNISNIKNINDKINDLHNYLKRHVMFFKHEILTRLKDKIEHVVLDSDNLDEENIGKIQNKILSFFFDITNECISRNGINPTGAFTRFQSQFKDITGKKLELTIENSINNSRDRNTFKNIKIDDYPLVYNELSEGEKILFALSILLFYHTERKNNKEPLAHCILIVDEPERNLYPEATMSIIKKLREKFQPDQFFLASHSIDVLVSLDHNERYEVENDKLLLKNDIGKIIETLYGNLFSNLQLLSTSIFDLYYHNFITQCLSEPETCDLVNPADPQVKSFVERCKARKDQHLKILEIGAGEGRIYKSSIGSLQGVKYTYSAYETNLTYRNKLRSSGITVIDNFDNIAEGTFDIILFCNVLHEIEPVQWIYSLNKLISALKQDGEFIFIERNILSKGEHAHKYDFFVLGNAELQKLFSISDELANIASNEHKSKISCIPIPKALLTENIVTQTSIQEAIELLKNNSWTKLRKIKENNPPLDNAKRGQELSFYSVQYINSCYYLEDTNQ
jgi:energy-coupling factor transporter ATP-binding protein EcfA2